MIRRPYVVLALLFLLIASTIPTVAAEPSIPKLVLRPYGTEEAYFSLELNAGEQRELSVEIGNLGSSALRVRSYQADAYSLINGGFGARLNDEGITPPTTWVDFPAQIDTLDPDVRIVRNGTLAIPSDTPPGEYITSLVVENADPIAGSGPIAIEQVVRQAIAVAITVPGPVQPALTIGEAHYATYPSGSSLLVGVSNTGNVHLRLSGDLRLRNADEEILLDSPLALDTIYAGTSTEIEISLVQHLPPGDYDVSLDLSDHQQNLSMGADRLPLSIEPEIDDTPAGITMTSVIVDLVLTGDVPRYADISATIDNPGLAVNNARLMLLVVRDGTPVEEYPFAESLTFPTGETSIQQRYIPPDGWVDGTYSFSMTLDTLSSQDDVPTVLAQTAAATTVVVG